MTGAARNFPAPDGDFLLGAFFELGYASLGTFNSSEPGAEDTAAISAEAC